MLSNDRLSEERLLRQETLMNDGDISSRRSKRRFKYHTYLWGFQLIFFLISLSNILRPVFYQQNLAQRCNCEDHMPMYSPALEAVRDTGYTQRFDGSFPTPNEFKGTPSPDIDAAWATITYENGSYAPFVAYGIFSLTAVRRRHQYI